MAIHFVSGKPGHGKTLYSVGKIVRELSFSARRVITNVPLDLPRVNEYIQEKHPKANPELHDRLVILDETQTKEFWKFRGDDDRSKLGCLIVIDEIHIHFNAREWMKTGKDCLHYISQHRKLNDDIIAITQSIGNVDKQFRSVAEDFSVMRNEYSAKFGPFRGRGRFTRKTYDSYTGDSQRQVPFEVSHFQLDASGIASCYNTSAGVGVLNDSNPNKLKPAKGIPVMLIWPVLGIIVILITLVPWFLSRASADQIEKTFTSENSSIEDVKEIPSLQLSEETPIVPEQESVELVWTGYTRFRGTHYITIESQSDSMTVSTSDPRLELITPYYVVYDGEKVHSKGRML
ncbi:zonular occludens toxin domain-containing protein [Puniceicoccaceae bacterium K14]|nr:zonular occludens toxin domain-containing protein [Puniceicoccaceae bacterium K14]